MTILSILIPLFTGLLITIPLLARQRRWGELLLALALAPGVGAAVDGLLYFIWLLVLKPGAYPGAYLALEMAVLLAALIILALPWLRERRPWQPLKVQPVQWMDGIGGLILMATLANFLYYWQVNTFQAPNGGWDALGIWNLHARYLSGGADWRAGFSAAANTWTHADYPLLLPGLIARTWALTGSRLPLIPAAIELGFLLSILGTVTFGVGLLRGRKAGIFAGLFTMAVLWFGLENPQYADMELAFYILAANLCLWLADPGTKQERGLLVLAGFMAGAAVWTKNEGWAFLLALVGVELLRIFLIQSGWLVRIQRWAALGLGLLPPLAGALVFKFSVAPPNDLFGGSMVDTLWRLTNLSRYRLILETLYDKLLSNWHLKVPLLIFLVIYLAVVGWQLTQRERQEAVSLGARIGAVLLVYLGTYVITPYPLTWHLDSSMERLISHLLPSLILLVFFMSRNLDIVADSGNSLPG